VLRHRPLPSLRLLRCRALQAHEARSYKRRRIPRLRCGGRLRWRLSKLPAWRPSLGASSF
jgi:hypothetical protein